MNAHHPIYYFIMMLTIGKSYLIIKSYSYLVSVLVMACAAAHYETLLFLLCPRTDRL